MADPSSPAPSEEAEARPLTIVGVGGSAGGFEAFRLLLENLPDDLRMSVVFILHLLPTHKSMLSELLSRATRMTVVQAQDEMPLEANRVYVIPPDAYLEVREGRLRLSSRAGQGASFMPIDRFFISLAETAKERAIGVVLSGTGADGAIGLRQIREAGGIAFVQSPESADHDEMPRAAAASGDADFVLPPAEIAKALAEFDRSYRQGPSEDGREHSRLRPSEEQFGRIFSQLRTAVGVDFSHYKRPTIERRLQRRMALHKLAEVREYLDLLERQPQEARLLYQDILIHVTFFFREPDSFAVLAEKVFPKLLAERRGDEALRIWTPGCSSGEEPYSVAISLLEFLGDKADGIPIQLFATDISETAIETARAGLYSEAAVRPVAPERLRRYFSHLDGKYRVNKRVREMCIFARHDLMRDPPFSRLDLVVCRNVLIYLDQFLQQRLLAAFHYALKPNGFLMLGGAETVGFQADLFTAIDKKHRLYGKRATYAPAIELGLAEERATARAAHPPALHPPRELIAHRSVQQEANQLVMAKYAPPGVLVNDKLEVVQFRGQTGLFIEPAPGDVTLHVLKLVRPGLLHELQQALAAARQSQAPVRKEGLHVAFNSHGRDVDLEVVPILAPGEPMHFLVLFEDVTEEKPGKRRKRRSPEPDSEQVKDIEQVERELSATRRYLQQAIQDLETANEELQSANEEILSSNEELQSTNEELDTAKEELQSTNEELNTLNTELHSRNEELGRLNSDLLNLLSSVQLAVMMVDRALRIRRFTPAAEKLFNLIPTDAGRPMQHLKTNLDCPELEQWVRATIDTVTPIDREIQDLEGRWFALRVRPYCSVDNRIEGAVLALVDVDAAKQRELLVNASREEMRAILETVREGLVVLDGQLVVQTVNRSFCRMFQVTQPETEGRRIYDLGDGQWNIPELRSLLEEILPKSTKFEDFQIEHDFPRVGLKKVVFNARRMQRGAGAPQILLAIEARSP
jgi:two-component system CheB/CheR fusion protein